MTAGSETDTSSREWLCSFLNVCTWTIFVLSTARAVTFQGHSSTTHITLICLWQVLLNLYLKRSPTDMRYIASRKSFVVEKVRPLPNIVLSKRLDSSGPTCDSAHLWWNPRDCILISTSLPEYWTSELHPTIVSFNLHYKYVYLSTYHLINKHKY